MISNTSGLNRSLIIRKLLTYLTYILFAFLFWPFYQAILFAILFAFALNPALNKMKERFTFIKKDSLHITLLIASMVFIVFGPLISIVIGIITRLGKMDLVNLSENDLWVKLENIFSTWFEKVDYYIAKFGIEFSALEQFKSFISKVGKKFLSLASVTASEVPNFVFQFFIFLLVLYFALLKRSSLKQWFHSWKVFTPYQIQQLSTKLQDICNLVLISSMVVGAVQAIVISLAWFLTGHSQALLVFIITFFISFVPVVGSAGVTAVLVLIASSQGNYISAFILIAAGFLAGSIDNLIRTYMFSNQEESAHPMVTFLTILGAVILFGFSGLFIGPIITELAFKIGDILNTKSETSQLELPFNR